MKKYPGYYYYYKTVIKGTAQDLYKYFTDPQYSEFFYYGAKLSAPYAKGQDYKYYYADGKVAADGKITEYETNKYFEGTFKGYFYPYAQDEKYTNFRFEFEQQGEYCYVTFYNYGYDAESPYYYAMQAAWAGIISGYKYYAETGKAYGYKYTYQQAA